MVESTTMRWRFQFKLRTLLVSFAGACFALGFWRLYWWPYIKLESLAAERFAIECRFLQFGGPDSVPFDLHVIALPGGNEVVWKEVSGAAWSAGSGRYYARCDFSLRAPSGSYRVVFKPVGSHELHATIVVP